MPISPDKIFIALLAACVPAGETQTAWEWFRQAVSSGWRPRRRAFRGMLCACIREEMWYEALTVLQWQREVGYPHMHGVESFLLAQLRDVARQGAATRIDDEHDAIESPPSRTKEQNQASQGRTAEQRGQRLARANVGDNTDDSMERVDTSVDEDEEDGAYSPHRNSKPDLAWRASGFRLRMDDDGRVAEPDDEESFVEPRLGRDL